MTAEAEQAIGALRAKLNTFPAGKIAAGDLGAIKLLAETRGAAL